MSITQGLSSLALRLETRFAARLLNFGGYRLRAANIQPFDNDGGAILCGLAPITVHHVMAGAASDDRYDIAVADERIVLPQVLVAFTADLVHIDRLAGTIKEFVRIP